MRLSKALARAKEFRGTLFTQKTFYITPKTKVDFKLLKSVVTAHGGQVCSIDQILLIVTHDFSVQRLQQSPTLRMINGNSNRHIWVSCNARIVQEICGWNVTVHG